MSFNSFQKMFQGMGVNDVAVLSFYRPELKGLVDKFFDVVQDTYKKHLKGKGVIELDY